MISELESENLAIKVLFISFEHIKQLDKCPQEENVSAQNRKGNIYLVPKAKIGIESTAKCK